MTSVSIWDRDFVTHFTEPNLDYKVEYYSFAAIGGPKKAVITATGEDADLWSLLSTMRSMVKIHSRFGDTVWWGYQSKLDMIVKSARAIQDPTVNTRVRVGVSLDSFYNRVAVAYTELNAGDDSIGERKTTSWADNDKSQDEYGVKELLWTKDNATATFAAQARDRKLDQVKYPIPEIQVYKGRRPSSAKITCEGFWNTLAWNYYANAGTTEVDTATQVNTIITGEGEFISGIDKKVTSGVVSVEYRDGDATALFEIVQLLEMGTDNDLRMLAKVTEARRVEIYEEPALSAGHHLIGDDGSWMDSYGSPIRKEICPVGVWARMKDIVPASVTSAPLADGSIGFIEENEYDVEKDELSYITREAHDPWDFYMIKDG
jgi:hypothetical protein